MDIFSHGFWGGLIFGKNKRLLYWAVLFSILPDMIAFAPLLLFALTGDLPLGSRPEAMSEYPRIVLTLYSITHSMVIILPIYFLVRVLDRELSFAFLAWPLHILFDIPTHTGEYFPTPFLYPISDFSISGISWDNPYFMLANYTAIISITLFMVAKRGRFPEASHPKKRLFSFRNIPNQSSNTRDPRSNS